MITDQNQPSDSSPSETDQSLAEMLTLTRGVVDGITKYFNSAGRLHRIHGPAVIHPDGSEVWYRNGDLHRTDGPAVTYPSGRQAWYVDGSWISEGDASNE